MVSVRFGPNYAAVEASFGLPPGMPIQTFAGTPPPGLATGGEGFIGSLNGLNVAVYAYGGALLFAALLAEMRYMFLTGSNNAPTNTIRFLGTRWISGKACSLPRRSSIPCISSSASSYIRIRASTRTIRQCRALPSTGSKQPETS